MNSALNMNGDLTSAEVSDELRPGTRLLHGQYVIESFLNVGGFGLTYLARDSLDRTVVIKECFPGSLCTRQDNIVRARSNANQQEYKSIVRMFVQEARRLAKLDHPNIVGVHQVFEDNETAYMALDFIEGQDLLDIIEDDRQQLSPDQLRNTLLKLLDAIAFIHDHGILHRDISPDNILLEKSGCPVLIDFGAAREKASRASRVLSALHVVKDGYSPQEFYIAGGNQSPAGDIYALGATFYHVLTGEAPPNSQTRLAAIAADELDPYVPLLGQLEEYDDDFLGALDKALNVFPKDRHQSAQEWLHHIDMKKRREAALERAQKDTTVEKSISQLVAETNQAVVQAKKQEALHAEKFKKSPPVVEKKPFFDWLNDEDWLKDHKPAKPKKVRAANPFSKTQTENSAETRKPNESKKRPWFLSALSKGLKGRIWASKRGSEKHYGKVEL